MKTVTESQGRSEVKNVGYARMTVHRARVYNCGLGAESPIVVQGRDRGQGVGGEPPSPLQA